MINPETVTEVWMLKIKKVTQHLGYFGSQHGAAREGFVTCMGS